MTHVRLPRTTTPRADIPYVYASYSNLVRQLGAIDGFFSATSLAGRYLHGAAGASLLEQREFVIRQAQLFQVNTKFVDFQNYETHTSQLTLAGVFQQFELFCWGLKAERAAMGRKWPPREEYTTELSYALLSVAGSNEAGAQLVGSERVELFEYYRLLRNFFAHGVREQAKADEAFDKVAHHGSLVASEYHLAAPNRYDDLTRDDYLLATRLCKYLATDICRLSAPTSPEEIIRLLVGSEEGDALEQLMHARSTLEKLKRRLRNVMRVRSFYIIEEYPDIEEGVLKWILSLPSRSARNKLGRRTLREFAKEEVKKMP